MILDWVVERRVSELLPDLVAVEPVVALHGPRSVGKSTVLRGSPRGLAVQSSISMMSRSAKPSRVTWQQ